MSIISDNHNKLRIIVDDDLYDELATYTWYWTSKLPYLTTYIDNKNWLLHQFIWFIKTGVRSTKEYQLHHKNGNQLDCRVDNLELLTRKDHRRHHLYKHTTNPIRFNIDKRLKMNKAREQWLKWEQPTVELWQEDSYQFGLNTDSYMEGI